MNEHVEIKIFASRTKYRGFDQQDEGQIVAVIRQDVLPKSTVEYHQIKVKVRRTSDGSPNALVAYMLRKDTYTADVVKVALDKNFRAKTVEENYDDSQDAEEDESEPRSLEAASEPYDVVAATPVPEIPTARQAVEDVYHRAIGAGLTSKMLLGPDATVANYQKYLASGLWGFINVGHGSPNELILDDGVLSFTWFQSLASTPLAPAVVYFNSCLVFNPPLQPAIMHTGARTFIGGIVPLLIGPSEEVCKGFWNKILEKSARMGEALHMSEQAVYPEQGAHGISGDQGKFAMQPIRVKVGFGEFYAVSGMTFAWTHLYVHVPHNAFTPMVSMHYHQGGGVWADFPLPFVKNFGNFDVFGGDNAPATDEFVIQYTVNGTEFWENNGWQNYRIGTYAGLAGGNITLKRAYARRGIEAGGGMTFDTSWLEGEIYVSNLSYHKRVVIRYTADNWQTCADVEAHYAGQERGVASVVQGVEIWKFKTPTLNYNPASDHFQFVLYYLNVASGETYWDNNFEQNYELSKVDRTQIGE